MKTIDTIPNNGYVMTGVTVPATVKAVLDDGNKVVLATLEEAGQAAFVAPSSKIEVDQDDALITPVNFSLALSGAASGGGLPDLFDDINLNNGKYIKSSGKELLGATGNGTTVYIGNRTAQSYFRTSGRPIALYGGMGTSNFALEGTANTFTAPNNFTQPVGVADGVGDGDAATVGQMKAYDLSMHPVQLNDNGYVGTGGFAHNNGNGVNSLDYFQGGDGLDWNGPHLHPTMMTTATTRQVIVNPTSGGTIGSSGASVYLPRGDRYYGGVLWDDASASVELLPTKTYIVEIQMYFTAANDPHPGLLVAYGRLIWSGDTMPEDYDYCGGNPFAPSAS